jgi:hypothetical protein
MSLLDDILVEADKVASSKNLLVLRRALIELESPLETPVDRLAHCAFCEFKSRYVDQKLRIHRLKKQARFSYEPDPHLGLEIRIEKAKQSAKHLRSAMKERACTCGRHLGRHRDASTIRAT